MSQESQPAAMLRDGSPTVQATEHGDVSIRLGEAGETVITPLVTDFLARCPGTETVPPERSL